MGAVQRLPIQRPQGCGLGANVSVDSSPPPPGQRRVGDGQRPGRGRVTAASPEANANTGAARDQPDQGTVPSYHPPPPPPHAAETAPNLSTPDNNTSRTRTNTAGRAPSYGTPLKSKTHARVDMTGRASGLVHVVGVRWQRRTQAYPRTLVYCESMTRGLLTNREGGQWQGVTVR